MLSHVQKAIHLLNWVHICSTSPRPITSHGLPVPPKLSQAQLREFDVGVAGQKLRIGLQHVAGHPVDRPGTTPPNTQLPS